ncbi:vanadium-dependent haloperoxidase [Mesorhizobium sp. M0166]|uniref:vanadium-dependent haloperoxidase n=1 Tax=unclassified Mesorhizobium TaxID=325217 RepID=UPI003338A71B
MDRRTFIKVLPAAGFTTVAASAYGQETHLDDASRREFEDLLATQDEMRRHLFAITDTEILPEGPLDRVYYWNNVGLNISAIDHTPAADQLDGGGSSAPDPRRFGEQLGPHRSSYAMAVAQIAVFEAVNAFPKSANSKKYQSYTGFSSAPSAPADASLDGAIAQAMHDALAHLYPFKAADVRSVLDRDIARMSGTSPTGDKIDIGAGRKIGQAAAKSIIEKRKDDGTNHQEIKFADLPPDNGPLKWSIDPVSKIETALGAKWKDVTPFLLMKGDQFRLPDPPKLNDARYIAAFDEVKDIGKKGVYPMDTSRKKGETFRAIFWGYDGTPNLCAPPRLYNQLVRTITADKKISDPAELARILALCNTAMADAAIAAWDSKFTHRYWRPVTGIRWPGMEGDAKGDASNVPDPTWEPLGSPNTDSKKANFTPPFPAYPSGHATFGGALFQVLRMIFKDTGDDTPFVLVSDEFNGKHKGVNDAKPRRYLPLSFVALQDAEFENAFSRVWLGVHWRQDGEDGIQLGNKVGNWAFQNGFAEV